MPDPRGILFLCVANSARSQMAEGLARAMFSDDIAVFSAGSQPGHVHPLAIAAMAQVGIDIRDQHSKSISAVPLDQIDLIVTLCAQEVCPIVPGRIRRLRWPHDDPAGVIGSEATRGEAFARVRDQLRSRLQGLASSFAAD